MRSITFVLASALILSSSGAAADARIAAFENGLVDREERGDPDARRWSIEERMAFHRVPGLAIAIIDGGEVVFTRGYGVRQVGEDAPIDADTVFSVGSVSKMVNAALVLRLVAAEDLQLDRDVNDYLDSWKVPENRYTDRSKVTLRAILSHTAGFSQHGFADFRPGELLPTALQTLNGHSPARHGPVRLMFEPGDRMDYSGGGTTVSQVLITDLTGMSYVEAAERHVLEPLGMSRSTFQNPIPASHGNIAHAHDDRGRPTALPRGWEAMPEMAASGFWTSARDLGAFVVALMDSHAGESEFLPRELAGDMMTRVPRSWHGLGPRLNGEVRTHVFHHGGSNDSYRARIEGHLGTGQGVVLLTNGTRGAWLYGEVRKAVEEAFDWAVTAEEGYAEPMF